MVQAMHIALVVMTIVQICGKVFLRWSFTGMIGRSWRNVRNAAALCGARSLRRGRA